MDHRISRSSKTSNFHLRRQRPSKSPENPGPSDRFEASPVPRIRGFNDVQQEGLRARYHRYQDISQALLYHSPRPETDSTSYALLGHRESEEGLQQLVAGVSSGQLNDGEMYALIRFQRETERLRAQLRGGGYTQAEVDVLDARKAGYQELQRSFLWEDHQLPGGNGCDPADLRLDQAAKNGTQKFEEQLRRDFHTAYARGLEQRPGAVYADERGRVRARFQELRDQNGVEDRPRPFSFPGAPLDRDRAERLVHSLSWKFEALDVNRNGNVSRAELRAILAEPQKFGYAPQEAAALFAAQEQISGVLAHGNRNEDLAAADLVPCGSGEGWQQRHKNALDSVAFTLGNSQPPPVEPSLFGPDGVPDPMSIRQNRENSCWLLSVMSTLPPEDIQRMVRPGSDGGVLVRFPGRPAESVPDLTQAERQIYSRADGDWSAYIEKAVAQIYAREDRDISYGWSHQAMELLTGRGGSLLALHQPPAPGTPDYRDPEALGRLLQATRLNDQVVTAYSYRDDFESGVSNITIPLHSYAVLGFEPSTQTVRLRNPWGENERGDRDCSDDGIFTMSLREFQATFTQLEVQDPPR